ncbi:MAG: DNA polymerase IV [Gammaproteobacteria bacterium]|nr:DNA polymerase IV [Gammaproteobacteria bacterium]
MNPPPRSPLRVVLHADMDAFYASVEQHDNPELRGKPVIVGGSSARGVVAAASYEARTFGVHSAMPGREAARRCPDGIFIKPRMQRYREVSQQVFAIMRDITPLVEGLSLDEAFLDITGSVRQYGSATKVGEALRDRVYESTGLVISVGIAPSKFVAKIASDLEKPGGFVVVPPARVQEFLDPLPVKRLWGLGPKSLPRVESARLHTIGDIRRAPLAKLRGLLGNRAEHFQRLSRGEDQRPVKPEREDKSISSEETFHTDIRDRAELERELLAMSDTVARRLRKSGLACGTVTVKIREPDFTTHTRSRSFRPSTQDSDAIHRTARELLGTWWSERDEPAVRLLGVGASKLGKAGQISLFEDAPASRPGKLDSLMDEIRDRYGESGLRRGRLLDDRERGTPGGNDDDSGNSGDH